MSQGEQRALAAFLAGRMPAGQLHAELCRAREEALAAASAAGAPDCGGVDAAAVPAPALHAA
jgi:hypothetical protein